MKLSNKVMLPVIAGGIVSVAIVVAVMFSIKRANIMIAGLSTTKSVADQVAAVRSFYTSEVVSRAKSHGMRVNYDFDFRDDTLPLPATLTKALGKEMAAKYPGMLVRLYSDHPFPHRKDSEIVMDEFERQALRKLRGNPAQPVSSLEKVDGRLSMRYAVADRMKKGCVDCHNSHPETPKSDWRVGDVRGVVEVVIPVDEVEGEMSAGTIKLVFSVLAGVAGILIVVMLIIRSAVLKPIGQLQSATRAVSKGNLDIDLTTNSQDEIGELIHNFSGMVNDIRSANNALETEKSASDHQRNKLSNGVDEISTAMERFKAGDMSVRLPEGSDEMGLLNQMLNGMLQSIEKAIEELNNEKSEADRKGQYLTESVDTMLRTMDIFANGDLTVKLNANGDDEIAKLFDGFNRAVNNVRELMTQIIQSVDVTTSTATEIGESTEELAAGGQQQSGQTSQVAGAVEEMSRTIEENSRNAHKTAEMAERGGQVAKDGGNIVRNTIQKMREIAGVVQNSSETVERLGASSKEVGEVVEVINSLADQTNLLALNAAIEAARAGDQGRGFAVVADEVRKLAERTTESTKVIENTIKAIQGETHDAVEAMKQGNQEVIEGIALADKAGEALEQIVGNASELVELIRNIAAASEEQSATGTQVAQNVEAIASIVSQSAGGLQQIARSAEELTQMAVGLQTLMGRFKISGSSSPDRVKLMRSLKR